MRASANVAEAGGGSLLIRRRLRSFGVRRHRAEGATWLRGETGAATVFAASALVGLLGLTVLVGQVGAAVVARHRAQAAADLAALAAAGALVYGAERACAEGGEIARRMRTTIRGCEVAEWDVVVTVEGKVPMGLLGDRTVRARARAGPVEEQQ